MTRLARFRLSDGNIAPSLVEAEGHPIAFDAGTTLASLLHLPLAGLRTVLDRARAQGRETAATGQLAPIDGDTEVWAAGVTYRRSQEARIEESSTPDIYTKVYRAERPELFFKATPRRVAGPGEPILIRSDSTWDVPEPEVALVVNRHAEIIGYAIGNDVSSRSIEGDNPLYLPQAKLYAHSCALGPAITPVWEIADPYALGIVMRIERDGASVWQGETSSRELKRRFEELVAYLFREDDFPDGVILCTGTALVPDPSFTLEPNDLVEIEIEGLGAMRNPVVRGKASLEAVGH